MKDDGEVNRKRTYHIRKRLAECEVRSLKEKRTGHGNNKSWIERRNIVSKVKLGL